MKELWRISGVLYRETVFKGIEEVRIVDKKPEKLVESAKRQMWLNKLIVSAFLTFAVIVVALNPTPINCTILLVNIFFLFILFFLQVVTSFVSQSFDLLHLLPLSNDEIAKVRLLTFIRIFDLPLAVVAIVTPLSFLFHSIISAFWSFLGVVTTEVLAIAIVFRLAKFFHTKIAYSTGGWKSVLRVIYMVAWSFGIFAIYFLPTLITTVSKLNLSLKGLDFIFPVCFGYLMAGELKWDIVVFTTLYAFLGFYALKRTLPLINEKTFVSTVKSKLKPIKPFHPVLGIIRKDIRLISRSPAHFTLIAFPIVMGIFYTFYHPMVSIAMTLFAMVLVLLVVYGVESEIVKILPINFWTLTLSKTALIVSVYSTALICSTIVSLALAKGSTLLGFALIPSVIAMSIFVSSLSEKMSFKDMYTGLTKFVTILVPCLILAYAPIGIGFVAKLLWNWRITIASFIFSTIEMLAIIIAVRKKKTKKRS